jgi:outer membrane DcaP-like protein/porin-like protein
MTRGRNLCSMAAIGGPIAALSLLIGSPTSRADELADLRANQELLQKRLDQLSQAPPPGAPGPYVPGFGQQAPGAGAGAPIVTGSFPRSFLIPGTDTSLRIGGYANARATWRFQGSATGGQLNSQGGNPNQTFEDGMGGTGNLANIPLNNTISHARSGTFMISGRESRLLFDARTPTAWGQAKAYIEFDFSFNNTNVVYSNNEGSTNSAITRFRKGYAVLGGLEAGQDTGIMHDPDADPELVDFGGQATAAGRGRSAQIKYTYAGPYGTVLTGGIENPVPRLNGPFGQVDIDTEQVATIAACSVTGIGGVAGGGLTALTPASNACLGSGAFFSPLKNSWPEAIATARVNQPWGHLQVGAVLRTDQLNDGQFLDKRYVGYGGSISGDAHPFSGTPGPLGKDDLGFGLCLGTEVGNQCANGMGLVTNFGANLFVPGIGFVNPLTNVNWNQNINGRTLVNGINVRQAYDKVVRAQSPRTTGGWIWYQHWWTENLRSTLAISGIWNAMNTNIVGPNTSNNKLLGITYANLFWSPVAFVDFGTEFGWGHRQTVANFKGDAYEVEGLMRVRF